MSFDTNTKIDHPIHELRFLDGTHSSSSYAVFARRGNIFLGIKLSGLTDGSQLGLPGKTYLHARVRSARQQTLAEQLDLAKQAENIVNLFDQQVAVDEAWPNFSFDKVDGTRASLSVGMFIGASLNKATATVIARIEQGDLISKMVGYVIETAGPEYRIAPAKTLSAWLFDQVKPALEVLKMTIAHQKAAQAAQKEFGAVIGDQLEVVGAYGQQLKAIYQKHQQADAEAGLGSVD